MPPMKPTTAPSVEPRSIAQASTTTNTKSGRLPTSGRLVPTTDCSSAATIRSPAATTNRRVLFPAVGQDVQPLELIHLYGRIDDCRLERIGVLAFHARHFAHHEAFRED